MKVYKVKTIVAGYKLGPEFRGKDYVATKVSETDYLGRTTEREKSLCPIYKLLFNMVGR